MLRRLQHLVLAGKRTLNDMRINFLSWTANAKRGNTRGIVSHMQHYYNDLILEVSP